MGKKVRRGDGKRKIYCHIKRDAGVKNRGGGIFSEAFKKAPRVTKQIPSLSEGDTSWLMMENNTHSAWGGKEKEKRQGDDGELNENWNFIKHLHRITVAICHTKWSPFYFLFPFKITGQLCLSYHAHIACLFHLGMVVRPMAGVRVCVSAFGNVTNHLQPCLWQQKNGCF